MKTSIRTIGIALLVLSAFVGFAAADVSEPPDAGSSCSNARWFTADCNDYTNIYGTLTSSPVDSVDCWKSNSPNVGNTLRIYLSSGAYNNDVAAELFDGDGDLMQRVKRGNMVFNDDTLDAKPTCVKVSGFPGDYDYTVALYRGCP
jgi:hypothetical protein